MLVLKELATCSRVYVAYVVFAVHCVEWCGQQCHSGSNNCKLHCLLQRWSLITSGPVVAAYHVLVIAAAAAAGMQGQVDTAYLAAANYLKTIGFTNTAEIARVLDIAMNPNSLFVQYNDAKRSTNVNVSGAL